MGELRPRITGTEMEWSLQVQSNEGEYFEQAAPSDINRAFTSLDISLIKVGDMLSNGARLYKDVGDHPEYATPEDTSFYGTVANEIAGENILYDALSKARDNGVFHNFILNKRVVDDKLNTWGYHISLSANAKKIQPTEYDLAPLGPHLATMGLYSGAGAVVNHSEGASYAISQKILGLNRDFCSSSHGPTNPLISLRDEALAPDKQFSRIHITSLDANISPWATWMKLGTTSIVLRMMEQGYWDYSSMEFENEMHQVAIAVAYDSELNRVVRLDDGGRIRPVDVQGELLQRAQKMAETEGLPPEEILILAEWERALVDLAVDPDRLIDRADWVMKRAVLRRYMARHALGWADEEVMKKDRQWSHIGPTSVAVALRSGVWEKYMPTDDIERAYFHAPFTTRAFGRAAFIKQYANQDYLTTALWSKASAVRENENIQVKFDDPYLNTYTSIKVIKPDQDSAVVA